ncbi:Rossman fold protein, TIGR00730 family [candidate division KSB1 bacterium RBG_16_48_16]|nr:MAG: Rossman fold protein, TIGR00730 family [candidate division KSB1 bacterium RBG_16_48_16]
MESTQRKTLIKAYDNQKFLYSADARAIRILAEYLEPLYRLRKKKIKDTVVFFGSARTLSMKQAKDQYAKAKWKLSSHNNSRSLKEKVEQAEHDLKIARYYEEAKELAFRLTQWSSSLEEGQRFIVCSGGGPGIMEAANRGAAEAGGPTIGMNISIPTEQYPNPYIDEDLSFEFHYFFMRKFWFVYTAKALVVFPGGFGTMDELFELLTLRQTQKVKKPLAVVVYSSEYWNSVIHFEKLVEWGTISQKDLELFNIVDSVDQAFGILKSHFEENFVGKKKYWHL